MRPDDHWLGPIHPLMESVNPAMANPARRSTWSFGLAIFLGAWLIFQIQPLMSKLILPWFGGTPQVWTVCLLFFQSTLFAGYVFAHVLQRTCSPRGQVTIYIGLLIVALLATGVMPTDDWRPTGDSDPTFQILLLLARFIGLPYLLLSATGPLMQAWYHRSLPERSPWWLYGLSNTGSLLGLLAYPFVVDYLFPAAIQVRLWLGCYVAYLASAALCGVVLLKTPLAPQEHTHEAPSAARPIDRLLWFVLAMVPTIMLAAVTSKLSVDISPVPFLWVLPLTLYLLSFILCFSGPGWYSRLVWGAALAGSLGIAVQLLLLGGGVTEYGPLPLQFVVYLGLLLCTCMVCHGELVRLKPHQDHLTEFYLWISAGGAAGGFLTGVIAPHLFPFYLELHVAMVGVLALLLVVCFRDPQSPFYRGRFWAGWAVLLVAFGILLLGLGADVRSRLRYSRQLSRNFYGVLRIIERLPDQPKEHFVELVHGGTRHGKQFLAPDRRRVPTTYYGEQSGVGLALRRDQSPQPRRVGVVGLGVGTLAAYGRSGDEFDFFEINPLVIGYAKSDFYYLADSAATCRIIPGDARISLDRLPPQGYDVLALDAFSSDAVPVHLLTEEAMEIYLKHMRDGGIIAAHVSNRYFDLLPVLAGHAERFHLTIAAINNSGDLATGIDSSTWVLLARDPSALTGGDLERNPRLPISRRLHWTDAHSSLLPVLIW